LNLTGVLGQEGCIVPIVPGYVEGIETWLAPCECDGGTPDAYAISETVTRGNYVTVWVDSAGLACPPYNLSVGGTGFHFSNIAGPITGETDDNLKTIELWADDTACGSALVTVTDACAVRRQQYPSESPITEAGTSFWERGWCCFCYCVETF
ncbi:MAG: hypothetical protein JRJ77_09695, partial [Deltaproteobacteria bacterium]|nr:hypothetical protein [Deltaproteobacteria bacterium]